MNEDQKKQCGVGEWRGQNTCEHTGMFRIEIKPRGERRGILTTAGENRLLYFSLYNIIIYKLKSWDKMPIKQSDDNIWINQTRTNTTISRNGSSFKSLSIYSFVAFEMQNLGILMLSKITYTYNPFPPLDFPSKSKLFGSVCCQT